MKRNDLQPVITETSIMNAKKGWYTFRSLVFENKNSLREQIEKIFKVKVLEIKTLTVKGKSKKSLRTRKMSTASDWKKVFVKLSKDQKIDAFDQI